MKKNYLYAVVALIVLFVFSSCKSTKVVFTMPFAAEADSEAPVTKVDKPSSKDKSTEVKVDKSSVKKDIQLVRADTFALGVDTYSPIIKYSSKHTKSDYSEIQRVVKYDFTHRDIPAAFEGFRIAFVSDLHYKSLFDEVGLEELVKLISSLQPDVLLMGGDYQEGCEYVEPLFSALAQIEVPMGIYGVMGNNDYERCHEDIVQTMKKYGMHPLEHQVDTLHKDGQQIIIAGVRNPFDLKANGISPTLALSPKDFVVLLVHTPDYIEDVSIENTDLALAGHTHGGQVRILGSVPANNSHYGKRFISGLAYNSKKQPINLSSG